VKSLYLVTAACYNHVPIVGLSPERISECEEGVLEACRDIGARIYAWCILPNHYHLLTRTGQIKVLLKKLGQFHGRSSFAWNGRDKQRGRHCWYNAFDRYIRSDRHFFASLNYVHHNPVHHGYVEKWLDWPWSSASEFIEQTGRDEAARLWKEYPLLDYGKKWDIY
jgi:putative transposase